MIGRQIVVDAEPLGIFADQRHADVLRQPHRHDVARALDAEPQRRRSVELAFVVLRPPDARAGVDLDRRIEHDGRRRVAVVERGGVDQRLERGTRLSQRLGGAVELALVEREAADHREHAAGLRIERDDGAGDFRHLAQPELPFPAFDRHRHRSRRRLPAPVRRAAARGRAPARTRASPTARRRCRSRRSRAA